MSGGILGLVFAVSTLGMPTRSWPASRSAPGEIGVDLRVLAFAIIMSLGTGLFFGILPALASKVDLATAMKQGARERPALGRKRLTNGLIVAQVTVSVVLLTGRGASAASFYRLQKVDPGYRADQVTSADIFTNFSRYPNLDTQPACTCRFWSGSRNAGCRVGRGHERGSSEHAAARRPSFQIEGRTVEES